MLIIDMMKASEDVDTDLLTELIIAIIADDEIPQGWPVSSTVNSYKGK